MVRRNEEGDDVEDEVKDEMKEEEKTMRTNKVKEMIRMKKGERIESE